MSLILIHRNKLQKWSIKPLAQKPPLLMVGADERWQPHVPVWRPAGARLPWNHFERIMALPQWRITWLFARVYALYVLPDDHRILWWDIAQSVQCCKGWICLKRPVLKHDLQAVRERHSLNHIGFSWAIELAWASYCRVTSRIQSILTIYIYICICICICISVCNVM